MKSERKIPAWQQAIIDKCYHPTGVWEELPESEYESSIPVRFESIAARFPNRLAVVDDQHSLTYAELNAAANRVAHGLLEHLGKGSEPVIHLFEHNVDAIIAVLGILKAGKFYVPLNSISPPEYLQGIIETMESRLILTDSSNLDLAVTMAESQVSVKTLADIESDILENLNLPIRPDDYFYVVFTSGSTGTPKGVLDIHRNVLRFAAASTRKCHISAEDRCLGVFRLSFSGSLSTLGGILLFGASAYLYDIHRQGIRNLPRWISQHRLTVLTFTPPAFRMFADVSVNRADFSSVRLLRLGGDSSFPTDLAAAWRLFPDTACIWIGLGASEAKAIAELVYDKQSGTGIREVAVGWPNKDLEVLLADEAGNRLPKGAVGEIVVRSRYNSPGYWKQPALTQQKFRPDPNAKGVTYYHTGDLGRMDEDGLLFHMGRVDSQVKIRGQRVELGEIEHALLDMQEVREAVVLVRGQTIPQQRLLAWLVWTDAGHPLTVSELRRRLVERLPSYMVPAGFLALDRLPLNANGKVDRHALPAPDDHRPALDSEFVPPQTPFELEVAQVWSEVLGIDRIGIHDNFFELGGDSIRAMQVLARLQQRLASMLHIQAIFDAPTVAEMATYLTFSYMADNENDDAYSSNLLSTTDSDESAPGAVSPIRSEDIARYRALNKIADDVQWRAPRSTEKNPRTLFILAPPRSGTTLLRVMLAGHSRLFAPPELYLLSYADLLQRRRQNEGRTAYRLEGSVRALMALHNCTAEDALEMTAGYEQQNLSTQEFYAVLQNAADGRLLVDKTPLYATQLEILRRAEKWFDEPVYIHLSRHPCGMIHSYIANHFHLRSNLGAEFPPNQLAELTWMTYHENIEAFLKEVPTERSLHVRYEDLAMEPKSEMNRICDFLEIDFQAGMLDPYDDSMTRMTDGIYPESTMIGDPSFHRFSQVSKNSVDAWRQTLHHDMLCPHSKRIAERYGYVVS